MQRQLINRISFNNLRGDLFGGITTTVIALPMALAFGVASGAGPIAGLYGAVLVGFFAALFGGTPTLISEPTGPMTVVITGIIAYLIANNPENGMAMAFTVVMMGGAFQILFGFLGLGKFITLMPYTVISGFMSGIGWILIILQIPAFLGQENPGGGVVGVVSNMPNLLTNINVPEASLAAITVAIIFLTPSKVSKIVPPQLVALVVGTLMSLFLFQNVEIARIGEIPSGLPQIVVPTFTLQDIGKMTVDALMLGVLGSIDALLTATVADGMTNTQHNSDKELIGQGIGNIVSGLFGGLPGAGATMGTVVNIQSGGKTPLSGLIRAGILLVVVLWAGGLTENIPMAVLAGIALKVGFDIIDWGYLKRAHRLSIKAALIMYGVMILTVFVDLITAVAVGIFIANILTVKRLSDLQSERVKPINSEDDEIFLDPEEKRLLKESGDRVLLLHLSGAMIFGASKAIAKQREVANKYEVLIIDLSDLSLLGVSSSLAIETLVKSSCDRGNQVLIVTDRKKVKNRLQSLQIFQFDPRPKLKVNRKEAIEEAIHLVNDTRLENSNGHFAKV
ncbi:MAG: SulP family inorganic anion transporter [Prochloraceae cyanobacterium]|nr:SulP family inorganic anion transporter [Prochloraceae cyanobacterium]